MGILIFSDINDTIKSVNKKKISQFCIDAIKKVQKKNVEFVLVTGKNRQKTEEFASVYGGSRYIITSNGGEVFDTKTRKVLFAAKIPNHAIVRLYEIAKKYNLRLILNVDADFRFTTRIKYFDGSEKELKNINEVLENFNVIGGVLNEIPDNLIHEIKHFIFETDGIVIANQEKIKDNNLIDFISEYANKGVAIKKLLKYLNVDYKDTISIGNEKNDIPMFSATCYNVAVANSCDEIKQMVDAVIDSVNNDGVAKFLTEFCNKDN